jgi:hypothetical protein
MRIRYKSPKSITKVIPSSILVETVSWYDMATMFCEEGADLSKYEHYSKKRHFTPSGHLYVPYGLDSRPDDLSGKIMVYDYDNDKRTIYSFKRFLKILKNSKFRNERINKNLLKYLPKLRKNEFIRCDQWVYPYYYWRIYA